MAERRSMAATGAVPAYERPHLTVHGSLAETTQANLVGIFIDNNLPNQGRAIIGNTSL